MHRRYWEFQSQNVQILFYGYQSTNGQNHDQNHGPVWKTQSFLLNEICTVILWQDHYGKGKSRKFYWHTVGKRFPNWDCFFAHREKGLFLSVYVDNFKLVGKKQNTIRLGKYSWKPLIWEKPTPFLDHVYLGCTERECQISEDIVDNYKILFESRISAGALEKYQKRKPQGNLMPKRYLRGLVTWKVTWKDIANWRIQRLIDYTKSQRHVWMTTNLEEEEFGSLGDLSTVCSQIVVKCLYLARIGSPDILWSVNKLAWLNHREGGLGFSQQLSWPASSAILARRPRSQRTRKKTRNPPTHTWEAWW